MKINKETRQVSRQLLRSSMPEGALDWGRINQMVQTLIAQKPRNYIKILEAYCRLLRLEVQKRSATIESATPMAGDAARQLTENLRRKFGSDLATKFVVHPELLGGMRIRVGSDVWDSSVRNRLHRLQQQL